MKLLFKQRLFSWLDSYDVYHEDGQVAYQVEGRLSWGHCLEVHDSLGTHLGTVKQEVIAFMPRFRIEMNGATVGYIRKELTFLRPKFTLDFNGWRVQGSIMEWDYVVMDGDEVIMRASKQLLKLTDTYEIEVLRPENALVSLMIVLAIDAAKCSSGNG